MAQQPLEDGHFSRSGAAVAALFSAAPFAALGGAAALAPFAAVAGLIAAPWPRLFRAAGTGGVPLALAALFVIWAGASLAWSPNRDLMALLGLSASLPLILLALGAGMARAADLALVRRAAIAGVVALLAILAFETLFEFPIARALGLAGEGNPAGAALELTRRGAALAALWLWGVAALLAPYKWPGWVATAVLAAVLYWIAEDLPYPFLPVALAAGLLPAALAFLWPRAAVSLTALVVAMLIVAAPSIMPTAAALSAQLWRDELGADPGYAWLARVDTWSYATGLIREKIVTGWGLGAGPTFTETHNLAGFTTPYMSGHPDNLAMHVWLETGAVGAILLAGALAAFGRRAGAALAGDRWGAAAVCGMMTTAFAIATVGVAAWSLWWWAGLAICAAMVRAARGAP